MNIPKNYKPNHKKKFKEKRDMEMIEGSKKTFMVAASRHVWWYKQGKDTGRNNKKANECK